MNRFVLMLMSMTFFLCRGEESVFSVSDSLELVSRLEMSDSLFRDTSEAKPEERYEKVVYTPRQSVLHIPIDINVKLLEKKINESFSGLLYEDANIEDDSIMLKAWKQKDFVIDYEKNELNYSIPVKIWVKKRFDIGFATTDREIEGAIDIRIKTSISFSKNWHLITKTTILNYEWIEKPVIKIAGLSIPITMIADKLIESNKDAFNKQIDKTIKEQLPLRRYVDELWNVLQNPIDISAGGYKAWIKTTPQQVYSTPIVGNYGKISTTIGFRCLMEVFMGDVRSDAKAAVLPELKMYTKTSDGFNINLLADIPYGIIDSLSNAMLVGSTFGEGRHSVTADSIFVFGQDSKLVFGVRVSGYMNGVIYLKGVPYYDKTTSSLRIRDVDYELETKNIFAKAVNLFYKRGLKRKIENEFSFPLKEQLSLVKELSRSELFNAQLVENVSLNAYIETLDVSDIFLTEDGVKVDVAIRGKMKLSYE